MISLFRSYYLVINARTSAELAPQLDSAQDVRTANHVISCGHGSTRRLTLPVSDSVPYGLESEI